MAGIFYVSSLSAAPLPAGISDKPSHAAAYLALSVLVVRAWGGGLPVRVSGAVAAAALAITIGYGVSDEFHQSFVPGRSAELLDLYADTFGAVVGTALCWGWGILSAASGRRRALPRQ